MLLCWSHSSLFHFLHLLSFQRSINNGHPFDPATRPFPCWRRWASPQSLRWSFIDPNLLVFFFCLCFPILWSEALVLLSESFFLFAGWGTDENTIISILAHRSAAQRCLIRQHYAQVYGEDLLKSLDKEISGDFEVMFHKINSFCVCVCVILAVIC